MKYLSAQAIQAGVGVVGFQKMEEHLPRGGHRVTDRGRTRNSSSDRWNCKRGNNKAVRASNRLVNRENAGMSNIVGQFKDMNE